MKHIGTAARAGALALTGGVIAALATALIMTAGRPATVIVRPAAQPRPAATATSSPKPRPKPAQPTTSAPASPAPAAPAQEAPPPADPAPARTAQPPMTNAVAVVDQYYQDITDGNYQAAWAIGGANLAAQNGQSYASWENGYASTTASISLTSWGTWGDGTVWCYISATQLDGSVRTYYGTYTVAGGVITSASIRQA